MEQKKDKKRKVVNDMDLWAKQEMGNDIWIMLFIVEKCMEGIAYSVNTTMKSLELPIRIMKKYAKKQVYWHWVEQISPPVIKKGKRGKDNVRVKKGMYKYLGSNFDWQAVKKWNKRYIKIERVSDSVDVNKKHLSITVAPENRNKVILSKTAKKITKWNRQMRELYQIRREINKLQRKCAKRTTRYYDLKRTYKELFDRLDKFEKLRKPVIKVMKKQSKFQKFLTKLKPKSSSPF